MDIKPRRKRCEKGILRRKTERRKCYPQEIPEDKILLTFCPQTYHLLWIKIFSISAHLPILSKKPITGMGVKSNNWGYFSHPRHLQNKEKVAALALSFNNNLFLFYFGRAFPFIYF
jgi:hypothetical protein